MTAALFQPAALAGGVGAAAVTGAPPLNAYAEP